MYTCTPQPDDPGQSDNTTIFPKCLKEDDQLLLKWQKCDVCYKCLGLAPCTEPKTSGHNSKYKRTRSAYPKKINDRTKQVKPSRPTHPRPTWVAMGGRRRLGVTQLLHGAHLG